MVEMRQGLLKPSEMVTAILNQGGVQVAEIKPAFDFPDPDLSRFLRVKVYVASGVADQQKALEILRAAPEVVSVTPEPDVVPGSR
jgi:hypothetical protein